MPLAVASRTLRPLASPSSRYPFSLSDHSSSPRSDNRPILPSKAPRRLPFPSRFRAPRRRSLPSLSSTPFFRHRSPSRRRPCAACKPTLEGFLYSKAPRRGTWIRPPARLSLGSPFSPVCPSPTRCPRRAPSRPLNPMSRKVPSCSASSILRMPRGGLQQAFVLMIKREWTPRSAVPSPQAQQMSPSALRPRTSAAAFTSPPTETASRPGGDPATATARSSHAGHFDTAPTAGSARTLCPAVGRRRMRCPANAQRSLDEHA